MEVLKKFRNHFIENCRPGKFDSSLIYDVITTEQDVYNGHFKMSPQDTINTIILANSRFNTENQRINVHVSFEEEANTVCEFKVNSDILAYLCTKFKNLHTYIEFEDEIAWETCQAIIHRPT